MGISKITRSQFVSIVKNVVFAGVAAYVAAATANSANQKGAVLIGVMAALKVVEKLFTTS